MWYGAQGQDWSTGEDRGGRLWQFNNKRLFHFTFSQPFPLMQTAPTLGLRPKYKQIISFSKSLKIELQLCNADSSTVLQEVWTESAISKLKHGGILTSMQRSACAVADPWLTKPSRDGAGRDGREKRSPGQDPKKGRCHTAMERAQIARAEKRGRKRKGCCLQVLSLTPLAFRVHVRR